MICEKCGQETETVVCPSCKRTVATLGDFCYSCGCRLTVEESSAGQELGDDELDLENRVLCSDGACIGVIDENGFCKVCKKPYASDR